MNHVVELVKAAIADSGVENSPRMVKGIVTYRDVLTIDECGGIKLQRKKDCDSAITLVFLPMNPVTIRLPPWEHHPIEHSEPVIHYSLYLHKLQYIYFYEYQV